MRSSTTRFIAACVLLGFALVAYFFWYHTVVKASATAETLTNAIATRGRAEERISAAQAALADLTSEEMSVSGYFVANQNIVPFIEQLQSLGSGAGASVTISSVSAGGSKGAPTLTIALGITGTFDHVVRAVGAIEYAPYDLTVSGLTLTAGTNGTWQGNMTVVVGAVTAPGSTTLPDDDVATSTPIQAIATSTPADSTSSPQTTSP